MQQKSPKQSFPFALGVIAFIGISLNLSGCTKQSWYEGTKAAQTADCMKQPMSEYKDCNQQSDESYNSYIKKREALEQQPEQQPGQQPELQSGQETQVK